MRKISSSDLTKFAGSVYKGVILIAKRVHQLEAGDKKMIEASPLEKNVNIAIKEFLEGKISFKTVKTFNPKVGSVEEKE